MATSHTQKVTMLSVYDNMQRHHHSENTTFHADHKPYDIKVIKKRPVIPSKQEGK